MPEPIEPKPVFDGDWASASGVEKGRHSQRVREWRQRVDERAKAEGQVPAAPVDTGVVERDRSLALRTARAVARDADARDADRLTAAALLARIEEAQETARPPSVSKLHGLSEAELEALVMAHL